MDACLTKVHDFADDTIVNGTNREIVEEKLEQWRNALEDKELKISSCKTKYLGLNEKRTYKFLLKS